MNPKQHLNSLKTLFLAMLIGQVLFFLILFIFFSNGEVDWKLKTDSLNFYLVSVISTIGGVGLSHFFFKKIYNSTSKRLDFNKRYERYRTTFLLKLACLEAPILLNIILFNFFENSYFIFFSAILLIFLFINNYPSMDKVSLELGLDKKDQ